MTPTEWHMDTHGPSEELREAARLMRERAQAATPGLWRPRTDEHPATSRYAEPRHTNRVIAESVGVAITDRADAQHIASWSPPVALAVADWLEAEAFMAGETADGATFYPLRVARAYLGTGEG